MGINGQQCHGISRVPGYARDSPNLASGRRISVQWVVRSVIGETVVCLSMELGSRIYLFFLRTRSVACRPALLATTVTAIENMLQ